MFLFRSLESFILKFTRKSRNNILSKKGKDICLLNRQISSTLTYLRSTLDPNVKIILSFYLAMN